MGGRVKCSGVLVGDGQQPIVPFFAAFVLTLAEDERHGSLCVVHTSADADTEADFERVGDSESWAVCFRNGDQRRAYYALYRSFVPLYHSVSDTTVTQNPNYLGCGVAGDRGSHRAWWYSDPDGRLASNYLSVILLNGGESSRFQC